MQNGLRDGARTVRHAFREAGAGSRYGHDFAFGECDIVRVGGAGSAECGGISGRDGFASASGGVSASHDSMPITLRKTLLWSQKDPILDVSMLEENGAPSRIAVLSAEKFLCIGCRAGSGRGNRSCAISHARPWPRDLRGRLVPAKDHLLDAYLPGVICRTVAGGSLAMNCRESDDPWPMVPAAMVGNATVFPSAGSSSGPSASISQVAAFFAPTRNFFTGVLTPAVGKFRTVPKFYSAAFVPRDDIRFGSSPRPMDKYTWSMA